MPKLLIIEDEQPLAEGLAFNLRREGFEVQVAADGPKGVELARHWSPDLVLLDLMLPGVSGTDVCREIRATEETPIIMLTAKSAEPDRVMGFAVGADDYVTKPFSMAELVARIRAVLRRSQQSTGGEPAEVLKYGPFEMNLASRRFVVNGKEVELTRREFDLLETFLRYPGRVFTREALLSRVWGETVFIDDRTVDVHVRWLRQKIEADPSHPSYLQTVRSVGYRFGD